MEELVNILKYIWLNKILKQYSNGLIVTERALQAEIYHQLKNSHSDYLFWVEPTLYSNSSTLNYKKPDILISKEREIVGIIELKYKPDGETFYKEDINKMKEFSETPNEGDIRLITIPNTGKWSEEKKDLFSVSPNILSVFAVIANDKAHAVKINEIKNNTALPKNFLHLTGSISEEEIKFHVEKYSNLS